MADQSSGFESEPIAEFAASLAHNLNNMLQVVNGNLEILSTRIEDENLLRYLENAQAGARQLTDLAHQLSEYPHEIR